MCSTIADNYDLLQMCSALSPALGPALAVPGPSQTPAMLSGIAPAPQLPAACPTSSQTFVCSLNNCNVSPVAPQELPHINQSMLSTFLEGHVHTATDFVGHWQGQD